MVLNRREKICKDLKAKFIFYYITGQETKAGCLNLMHNLLNRNLVPKTSATSNKCN